jgi:predicted cation transporter
MQNSINTTELNLFLFFLIMAVSGTRHVNFYGYTRLKTRVLEICHIAVEQCISTTSLYRPMERFE